MTGHLALIGGAEFTDACREVDTLLLALAGAVEVVVLPTAAAYEHPARAVDNAVAHLGRLGGQARGLMVLSRTHALDPAHAAAVRGAGFLYLSGGSPMHLRSVLKDTPLWDALVAAWHDGAVVAASSAAAMALGDPMVDPRGGALTLGLGLLAPLAVVPHHDQWSADRSRRTVELARGFPLVLLDEGTAAVRAPDGTWTSCGPGMTSVYLDGASVGLSVLP